MPWYNVSMLAAECEISWVQDRVKSKIIKLLLAASLLGMQYY